jgi:hypothetical protein
VHQHGRDWTVAPERWIACEQLEEDDAESVDVAAVVDLEGARLLWAHIFGSPDNMARDCGTRSLGLKSLRHTEIHESNHTVTVPHDVRGLKIAVDNTSVMDGCQALANLNDHVARLHRR